MRENEGFERRRENESERERRRGEYR